MYILYARRTKRSHWRLKEQRLNWRDILREDDKFRELNPTWETRIITSQEDFWKLPVSVKSLPETERPYHVTGWHGNSGSVYYVVDNTDQNNFVVVESFDNAQEAVTKANELNEQREAK